MTGNALEEKDKHPELNVLEMVIRIYDFLSCAAHDIVIEKGGEEIYRRPLNVGSANL